MGKKTTVPTPPLEVTEGDMDYLFGPGWDQSPEEAEEAIIEFFRGEGLKDGAVLVQTDENDPGIFLE